MILRINVLRPIKLPERIGWALLRCERIRPIRLNIAKKKTIRNGLDVHPMFCPKEGTHKSRLKKITTKTAPVISKFCSDDFVET